MPTDDNEGNRRPDYVVDVYEQYHYVYSSCYGEVKTEKSNDALKIVDFLSPGFICQDRNGRA